MLAQAMSGSHWPLNCLCGRYPLVWWASRPSPGQEQGYCLFDCDDLRRASGRQDHAGLSIQYCSAFDSGGDGECGNAAYGNPGAYQPVEIFQNARSTRGKNRLKIEVCSSGFEYFNRLLCGNPTLGYVVEFEALVIAIGRAAHVKVGVGREHCRDSYG